MASDEVGVLQRILVEQRLLASNRVTRDAAVCCFTEVPLDQFAERRVFRPHLQRWDFLSCGISIRQACLRQLGGRPVIYGNEADWQQLPRSDRPFFQPATSSPRGNGLRQIDWRCEREWRLVGDLNLRRIAPHDLLVFIEANQLDRVAEFVGAVRIVIMD